MSWQDELLEELKKAPLPKVASVAPVRRLPRVTFGSVEIEWIIRDDDLIYHLYLPEGHRWPDEDAMRHFIGDAFESVLGGVSGLVAGYTEELDSWAIKLPGFGSRTGEAFAMATAEVGRVLADKMEAA